MTRREKVLAGVAAVVLVGGGGGAIAIAALDSSDSSPATTAALGGAAESPSRGFDGGPGAGFRNFGGGRGGPFGGLEAAATYLGISTSTLMDDLATGKTLAQVAEAKGKTTDGLVSAIVAAEKKQLDAAVASGRVSQAQEQAFASTLAQRAKDLVDGARQRDGLGDRNFGSPGLGGPGLGDDGGSGGLGGSGSGTFGSSGSPA